MYVHRVSVCASFQYTCDLFCCSAGMCLLRFVYGVQHLEHRIGFLKPSVAFHTGDHKSGLTVHTVVLHISW